MHGHMDIKAVFCRYCILNVIYVCNNETQKLKGCDKKEQKTFGKYVFYKSLSRPTTLKK